MEFQDWMNRKYGPFSKNLHVEIYFRKNPVLEFLRDFRFQRTGGSAAPQSFI